MNKKNNKNESMTETEKVIMSKRKFNTMVEANNAVLEQTQRDTTKKTSLLKNEQAQKRAYEEALIKKDQEVEILKKKLQLYELKDKKSPQTFSLDKLLEEGKMNIDYSKLEAEAEAYYKKHYEPEVIALRKKLGLDMEENKARLV